MRSLDSGTDQQQELKSSKEQLAPPSVTSMEALAKEDIDEAVQSILHREKYAIKELDKYLQHHDFLNERKKELLHRRWVDHVACPLQKKIMQKVSSHKKIIKRRQEELENFINYVNKKGVAFREHYDPKEYDPFHRNKVDPTFLKVTMPPLHDPLKKAQFDRDDGKRTLLQCETGKRYSMKEFKEIEEAMLLSKFPKLSMPRHSLTPKDWFKVSECYIESELCQKSRLRVKKNINEGSIWRHCTTALYPLESHEEKTKFMNRSKGFPFLKKMPLHSQEGKNSSLKQIMYEEHFPSLTLDQQDAMRAGAGTPYRQINNDLSVQASRDFVALSEAEGHRRNQETGVPWEAWKNRSRRTAWKRKPQEHIHT